MKDKIQGRLFSNQDLQYKDFISKTIPNLSKEMIGVRSPIMRQIAKDIYKGLYGSYEEFLTSLPHEYHEEDMVHGYILEKLKDYHQALIYLEDFLPYISNWAVCDSFNIKSMEKYPGETLEKIRTWLEADHEYTVRFAIVSLLRHFTKKNFKPEINDLVANVDREEYYIKMAQGWYFQQAFQDQRDQTLPYFKKVLEGDVKKFAIQKVIDSRKTSDEDKDLMRLLRKK